MDCMELDTTLSKYIQKAIPAKLDSAMMPVSFTNIVVRRKTFRTTDNITEI